MNRVEKWAVWSTSVGTVATGVGYFWTKYLVQPTDPWAVINHPLQPVFLKAHILVSPLLVFALGMILLQHVVQHLRNRTPWARRSGLAAAVALAPMIVTGYLIQAITHTGWLTAMAWAHIGISTLYAIGLAAHAVVTRRARRAAVRIAQANAPQDRTQASLRRARQAV